MNIEIGYRPPKGGIIGGVFCILLASAIFVFIASLDQGSSSGQEPDLRGGIVVMLNLALLCYGIWKVYQYQSNRKSGEIISLNEVQISIPHKSDKEIDIVLLKDITEAQRTWGKFGIKALNKFYHIDSDWCADKKKYEELADYLASLVNYVRH